MYPEFDRSRLEVRPLRERKNDLSLDVVRPLEEVVVTKSAINTVARRLLAAKESRAAVIFMIGGHVVRSGVQPYIIDLMKSGLVSCLAMNGACVIHDYELSLIGATTESVARYITEGRFGLWKESGDINDIIRDAYAQGLGMGEAVGKAIDEGQFPYSRTSILAAAYRLHVPATVHVGIGYDIIHEHPSCDGAATGATSYRDFLRFAKVVENLENGVVLNFGSAVMGPEVFLKALSMARNVAHRHGRWIKQFTTCVCDLHTLPEDTDKEPEKENAAYYFRPWKTMLVRTVADGGESFYIHGRHSETIPQLWTAVRTLMSEKDNG
jgi:hypothetical protein